MAKIHEQFTSDDAQILKSYQKMTQEVIKLKEQQAKLIEDSKKGNKQQISFMEKLQGAAKRGLGGIQNQIRSYATLTGAINLASAAIERQNRISERSKQVNISLADSQAAVSKNIGLGVSDAEFQRFLNRVEDIQRSAKFQSAAPLNMAASSILSATGGNQKRTLDILNVAAPFFRDQPQDLALFGGAMGDVMGATNDPSARRAMALMMSIQSQARIMDIGALKQLAPAVKSARVDTGGADQLTVAREVGALFATVGQQTGDVEGTRTRSAVIALSANLAKAFPQQGLTVFERLEMAQKADAKVQAEILKDGFDKTTKGAISEMVRNKDSATAVLLRETFQKIAVSENLVDDKRRQLGLGTGQLNVATQTRGFAGRLEQFDASDSMAAQARVTEILRETLDRTAISGGFDNYLQTLRFKASGSDAEDAIKILLGRRDEIMYQPVFGFGRKLGTDFSDLSADEQEQVKLLNDAVRELQGIKQELQGNGPGRTETHTERD